MGQARSLTAPAAGRGMRRKSMLPSRWMRWAGFLLIALLGLFLRLPRLGDRPMHTDEAVNAYIVGQLLKGEAFNYDPRDRHGPALAALALPLARMQGAKSFAELTESQLRMTSVLAGIATILLLGSAVSLFGFAPCLVAALLFACAPLSVYYDRYFIHESLFVFATFGLLLTGWRAYELRSLRHAALAGACAALMLAGKETALLQFAAFAVAALLYWLWTTHGEPATGWWKCTAAMLAVAVFLLISVVLFTWFGRNWNALPSLLQAVPAYLHRAHEEGHYAPFWYYLGLLAGGWSGPFISLIACIGLLQAVATRLPSPSAFLAFYAVLIAILYSGIPYKTPWLGLNLWLPLALLAGMACEQLWRISVNSTFFRMACVSIGLVTAVCIFHDTRQRVFVDSSGEDNPYAYAHTSEDLLGLPAEIERLSRQNDITSPRIAVIAADPWPLPWYLRHYSHVGFWQPGQQPAPHAGDADYYITSSVAADRYPELLDNFRPQFFGVRPGVLTLLWSPAPK